MGPLYNQLLSKVKPAFEGKHVQTVAFLWFQGERDARKGLTDRYIDSFVGIIIQLEGDLRRKDVKIVMGRLRDFEMENKT
ncbi:MAG TPA: hypothetical protein DCS60_06030 [Opitutae bacterium]|nr:hypothetical protein [Opitutae bacterium]